MVTYCPDHFWLYSILASRNLDLRWFLVHVMIYGFVLLNWCVFPWFMFPLWSSSLCGLWLSRGSVPTSTVPTSTWLGTKLLEASMVSCPAKSFSPNRARDSGKQCVLWWSRDYPPGLVVVLTGMACGLADGVFTRETKSLNGSQAGILSGLL